MAGADESKVSPNSPGESGAVLIAAVYVDQVRRAAALRGSSLQFQFLSRFGSGPRKVNR